MTSLKTTLQVATVATQKASVYVNIKPLFTLQHRVNHAVFPKSMSDMTSSSESFIITSALRMPILKIEIAPTTKTPYLM